MITTKDRDVLDIVTALTRDLRRNPKFCEMLEKYDEETSRHVTPVLT
jgi:hypothetical protein